MNRAYKVNYSVFALLLTPLVLRGQLFITMLSACLRPLELLHEQFSGYMSSISYRANAKVCYLQGLLNDEFDFYSRRIIVRTVPLETESYLLWCEAADKPVMLSNSEAILLNRDDQLGSNNEDFEVVLPRLWTMSAAEETRIKQIINSNKLASKKSKIVYE
jgi:hypothetical protein